MDDKTTNDRKQVDIKRLNDILKSTIDNIQNSKEEIEEIVRYSKNEHERLEQELNTLKEEIKEQISEVNRIERLNKNHRLNLSDKSKNFDKCSEEEIQEAYDLANQTRIILLLKREEEKNLIQRRSDLEIRLKSSYEVYKRAENLNKQIAVAAEYLLGNIENITTAMDELNQNYILGIKIIEAQEEERLRVARDIHDGPAQSLANIILKSELCERLIDIDKGRTKNEIVNLKGLTKEALRSVRNVIYELRPMSLDDLGLIPTLGKYIENFKDETGIFVSLNILGSIRKLDRVIEVALFRIIQEGLNNIRKHSKAKEVKVVIEKSITNINVLISDDGIGFDPEKHLNSYDGIDRGFGLISIKQRVELLEGSFKISSSNNKGTKLNIHIPMGEGDI